MSVITLEEIKQRAQGTILEIPDWDGNGKIEVQVRRIDLVVSIMKSGILPNELKVAAEEVFTGTQEGKLEEDLKKQLQNRENIKLEEFFAALDNMVKEALVEPRYDDVQAVYPFTLAQKMAIFFWLMEEVQDLKSFRE